jgi:ATP-dependent Lhr-like helicase
MEESGKLRRGHFVEGLAGAQFAFAGAVDRLRAARHEAEDAALLLSSCDPANPFGALLAWPATRGSTGRPRRAAGCSVVLVGGEPVLFLERGGARLVSFEPAGGAGALEPGRAQERLARALAALRGLFADRTRRSVRIEEIDGAEAAASALAEALVRAGFRRDYKGLTLDRFPA